MPSITRLHDIFDIPKELALVHPQREGFPLKAQTCNTQVTTQMVQNVCRKVYLGSFL